MTTHVHLFVLTIQQYMILKHSESDTYIPKWINGAHVLAGG